MAHVTPGMRILAWGALILALPPIANGQSYWHKHNITGGVGAAMPRADLRYVYATSPLVNVNYGFRFHPWFQGDIGFETAFHAAGVEDYLPTGLGYLRIRDYQYFLPMGGRVVVPIAHDRILFSAGGGGAYLRYSEQVRQPPAESGVYFDCPPCAARDGWAYYGLVATSVALDQGRHFRIGATGRVYRGYTEGHGLGAVPYGHTQDHWINVAGDFTFSF